MSYLIVTNNPKVIDFFASSNSEQTASEQASSKKYLFSSVLGVEGLTLDVFEKVTERLQSNWKLLSSPLGPNVPMIRSPYRSIIIESSEKKYDCSGIIVMEKAKERVLSLGCLENAYGKKDLALIDLEFMQRAFQELEGNV